MNSMQGRLTIRVGRPAYRVVSGRVGSEKSDHCQTLRKYNKVPLRLTWESPPMQLIVDILSDKNSLG